MTDKPWTEPGLSIEDRAELTAINTQCKLIGISEEIIRDAILAAVADAAPKWITTSPDNIPETKRDLWLFNPEYGVIRGAYSAYYESFMDDHGDIEIPLTTHWRYDDAPAPPEDTTQ